MMTKRVLTVAYYYPPLATSGSMRPLAFSRHLDRGKWSPIVLTIDPDCRPPEVGLDPGLGAQVPADVHVIRVGHADPLKTLAHIRSALRGHRSSADSQFDPEQLGQSKHQSRVASMAGVLAEQLFAFPDRSWPWLRPAVSTAIRELAPAPPHVVLATAPPWTDLFVAARIAKYFGVPLVLDFRDPWTGNQVKRSDLSWVQWRAERWESGVIAKAALLIANTEESASEFARQHPQARRRIITITNGFDQVFADAPNAVVSNGMPLQLCHFGTIYGQRTPIQLLRALSQLADDQGITGRYAKPFVRFVGGWEHADDSTEILVRHLEAKGIVRREPAVPHDECLRLMRRAPALLIVQPASRLQIPGKLYEYAASGRPLFVVGGDGATAALVERHSLGITCPDNTETITQALRRLITGEVSMPCTTTDSIACFDYRVLTGRLEEALNSVLCPPPP